MMPIKLRQHRPDGYAAPVHASDLDALTFGPREEYPDMHTEAAVPPLPGSLNSIGLI
jgi:hypothetical protein